MSVFLDSNWSQRAPSFPPLSCIGCIGCDTPLAEADIFGNFVYCRCWCWCHAESVSNGRDVCFCCYISVCCCEERAADVFCIYLPACLLKHTCCLQEQDRWMDGYPPPPPFPATRGGGGGRREMKMEKRCIIPTYLPVRLVCLLSGPCTLLDIHPPAALRQPTRYTTATVYSNKLRDDIVRVTSRQSPDRDPRRHGMYEMR